jgi:hypothetical protein
VFVHHSKIGGRFVTELKDMEHLSFREELHAIEAVIAGQGVGIFSDVLVAKELAAGTLVKAFAVSLPGYLLSCLSAGPFTGKDHTDLLEVATVSRLGAVSQNAVCPLRVLVV